MSASLPDATGHFGPYGGRFVPETLIHALDELASAYEAARRDPAFTARLDTELREFAGRPTPRWRAAPAARFRGKRRPRSRAPAT